MKVIKLQAFIEYSRGSEGDIIHLVNNEQNYCNVFNLRQDVKLIIVKRLLHHKPVNIFSLSDMNQ